jgi:hypothetical protein
LRLGGRHLLRRNCRHRRSVQQREPSADGFCHPEPKAKDDSDWFLANLLQRPASYVHPQAEMLMYVVRELMYCKPGKVRALVDKFLAMNALSSKIGMPRMRIMTDFAAERYWTVVAEMEVDSLDTFDKMMSGSVPPGVDEKEMKKMDDIMKGYHDLVDHGKREIYRVETAKS